MMGVYLCVCVWGGGEVGVRVYPLCVGSVPYRNISHFVCVCAFVCASVCGWGCDLLHTCSRTNGTLVALW